MTEMRKRINGRLARRVAMLCVWVMALVATGCVKNEFNVEFMLPAGVNSTYSTVYYASGTKKGWVIEGVVAVQNGKAKFRGATRNPTLLYIMPTGGDVAAVAYVERGDEVRVEGNDADALTWKISCNKLTESLSDWRTGHAGAIRAARNGAEADIRALNKEVAGYVSANPESPVSTLLLLLYYDRGADEAGFKASWNKLKGDAADPKWRELVSRADMLGEVAAKDKLPPMIVLNSVATGCDTIVTGRVPALLYVSRPGLPSYRDDIRELRQFSREIPDSARRVIANVSVEPDSSVRWNSWRMDSLTNAVQGWAPLGLSDVQLREMGVRALPCAIVIGKSGKADYRGGDMRKAIETMRRILR